MSTQNTYSMTNNQEAEVHVMEAVVDHQDYFLDILHVNARYQFEGIRILEELGNIRQREITELQTIVDKDQSELTLLRTTFDDQHREINILRNSIAQIEEERYSIYNNLKKQNAKLQAIVDSQAKELEARTKILKDRINVEQGYNDLLKQKVSRLEREKADLDQAYNDQKDLSLRQADRLRENEVKFNILETENCQNCRNKQFDRLRLYESMLD